MWLLVGDTHFTDHAKDQYRFGLFPWIKKQQSKYDVAGTFLCGDITDAKNRHSATLVNKIIEGLVTLRPPVYICCGNHDYRDPANPFFKFLNHIDGLQFITEPTVVTAGKSMAIIPHRRTQDEFTRAIGICGGLRPSALLVHQTFDGAIAETGARLSGLAASPIESLNLPLGVYAGDVHKPQRQGLVTYVGCPYHVRFGDAFEPRSILVDAKGKNHNLAFNAPHKWTLKVRGPENIANHKDLCAGDQVKLTIEVAREEAVEWKKIRADVLAACKEAGLEVYGVKLEVNTTARKERIHVNKGRSNLDTFRQFCASENLATSIRKAGSQMLGGSNGDKDIL